jgi:ankyrin repeat protein
MMAHRSHWQMPASSPHMERRHRQPPVVHTTKIAAEHKRPSVCSVFCYNDRSKSHDRDDSELELSLHLYKRGSSGESCLHHCAAVGHEACAMRMIRLGADPRWEDDAGNTPADVAKVQGHTEMFREFRAKALMMIV